MHASRRQKWYKYLEDRDVGNREALKALTVHMPKVTYIYMLHQVIYFYYVLILPAPYISESCIETVAIKHNF